MTEAKNAGMQIAWLPLSDQYRAKFNSTDAWSFFNQTKGLPYGFQTLFYSLIDTDNNMFAPFTGEFYPILLRYGYRSPKMFDIFFKEGLQKRMG